MRAHAILGIFVADTRQIRARPLRSPQHRMIVFGFDGERIRAVAFDLVAQCPDHLRMAGVATFADVDVTARNLERRVDPHVRCVFDGLMDREQRDNLDRAADAGHPDDGEDKADGLAFEPVMQIEHARSLPRLSAGRQRAQGRDDRRRSSAGWSAVRIVIQML